MSKKLDPSWVPSIRRFGSDGEWLEARRELITASDARAILGVGYANECALATYEGKISREPIIVDEEMEERFLIGHLMENVLIELFKRRRGINIKSDRRKTLRISKQWDFCACTLDAYYHNRGKTVPIEFKTVDPSKYKDWSSGDVPLHVMVQIQMQIMTCNADFGWVMAMCGVNDVFLKRVTRDTKFQQQLILKLLEFRSHVQRRVPPGPDWTVACEAALSRLHPQDNGLAVSLPVETVAMFDRLEELKTEIKELEKEQRGLKNAFRAMLGDNTYGVIPGKNSGVSWKTQDRKESKRVVPAGTSRVFRIANRIPKDARVIPFKRIEDQSDGKERDCEDTQGRAGNGLHPEGGGARSTSDDQQRAGQPNEADAQRCPTE